MRALRYPRLFSALHPHDGCGAAAPLPHADRRGGGDPSARLMMALALYSRFSPLDLPHGYKIAGAGAIDPSGPRDAQRDTGWFTIPRQEEADNACSNFEAVEGEAAYTFTRRSEGKAV